MKRNQPFSEEEKQIVLDYYGTAERWQLIAMLPGRSYDTIRMYGRRLGLRRPQSQPTSREVKPCALCGKVDKVRAGKIFPGHCDTCYKRLYAEKKRYPNQQQKPKRENCAAIQVRSGKPAGLHIFFEPQDRDIVQMVESAKARKSSEILPEIKDLFQAERRILQQLRTLRQHQQEVERVERCLSSREEI